MSLYHALHLAPQEGLDHCCVRIWVAQIYFQSMEFGKRRAQSRQCNQVENIYLISTGGLTRLELQLQHLEIRPFPSFLEPDMEKVLVNHVGLDL